MGDSWEDQADEIAGEEEPKKPGNFSFNPSANSFSFNPSASSFAPPAGTASEAPAGEEASAPAAEADGGDTSKAVGALDRLGRKLTGAACAVAN